MGFEYKIMVSLSTIDKIEIEELCKKAISNKPDYSFDIRFVDEGIYVCKYDKPDIWKGLEDLHNLIIKKKLRFEIEEI
jgi:hypothetical protein